MLKRNIILALNGVDDIFLEETARKLNYISFEERNAAMKNSGRRRSRRFLSMLIAATLLLSLGIAAYATEFFGIRALLIKDEEMPPAITGEGGGIISITQPQDVPEEIDSSINEKIENSAKAWAEWEAWRKENGIHRPKVFDPPKGCSTAEYIQNEDGTITVIFYKSEFEFGGDGRPLNVDYVEMERRTATAEEFEQDMIYADAVSKGYEGYDFNYNVYSQEMAEKLEEIAAAYGLKLRHESTVMYENFGEYTQFNTFREVTDRINRVCAGGGAFFHTEPTGYDKFYYFDEGTFAVSFFTTEDKTNMGTSCYLYNSPYSTLSSGYEIVGLIKDINAMSTYTHISPDGTELTVLHNGAEMYAYVYLENSFVTLSFHQTNGLSEEEINGIIDMINYSAIK